jgi:hypothetical protein
MAGVAIPHTFPDMYPMRGRCELAGLKELRLHVNILSKTFCFEGIIDTLN